MNQILNRAVLFLIFAAIAYNALAFGGVRLIDQVFSMVMTGLALGLFAIRSLASRRWVSAGGIPGLFIFVFFMYACARHSFADTEYASRRELIEVALGVALFYLTVNCVEKPVEWRCLIGGLLVVATAAALYASYQYFARSEHVWTSIRPDQYRGRGSGTFVNPNHLAGFLELVLPLGVVLSATSRLSWPKRIMAAYCVLAIIAGIVVTFSRGGWLAAASGLGMISIWMTLAQRRKFGWMLAMLLGVAIFCGLVSSTYIMRQRISIAVKEFEGDQVSTRRLIWQSAWEVWGTNPWWGVGADQFQYQYFAYRDPWLQTNPVRVHNDYLNTLCDYGLAGFGLAFIAVVGLFVRAFRGLGRVWRERATNLRDDGDAANLIAGAAAGALTLAIHSFLDFNLHIRANLLLGAFVCGLICVGVRKPLETRTAKQSAFDLPTGFRRWLGGALAAALAIGFIWQLRFAVPEALALRQFSAAEWGSREAQEALQRAARIEPANPVTLMKLGDYYRQRSMLGEGDYEKLGKEAIDWYERAMAQTPVSPYPPMNLGMCLDFLGRHDEARGFFERMIKLDPNGNRAKAMMGWHYFQIEDYARSREWIQRSLESRHPLDTVALNYDTLLRSRGY